MAFSQQSNQREDPKLRISGNSTIISRDKILKGILKSKFQNTARLSQDTPSFSSDLDFTNECRISNLVGPCETISSRKMDRRASCSEFLQAEQRLTANQAEDDDESYFMAFSSAHCSKPKKWIRPREREREISSDSVAGMRGNYCQDPDIQISRYNGQISRFNGGKSQSNCSGRAESQSLTRRLVFRLFQIASLLLIVMGIVTLVTPSIMVPEPDDLVTSNDTEKVKVTQQETDIKSALQQWTQAVGPFPAKNSNSNSGQLPLLDIPNLHFSLNNYQLCNSSNSSGIYFIILIHSAPTHFLERQAIRASWGSVKSFRNWSIRLVFLLGQLSGQPVDPKERSIVQEGVLGESDLYGDIVAGNFEDTYRNLTYKHLMGYKWVLSHCPTARFVIKTDDDAFVDIFQVFDFAQRNYGLDPSDILLCNIYPEGTKPVRNSSAQNPDGLKWTVTQDEYPFEVYPKYCGGLGYLATVDVIRRLSGVGDQVKRFLWIDDVFVTGVIRELAGKEPFYLNLRYSYDESEYHNWLDDRSPRHRLRKIPYMFVHVPRGARFDEDMARLWRKTVRAWS